MCHVLICSWLTVSVFPLSLLLFVSLSVSPLPLRSLCVIYILYFLVVFGGSRQRHVCSGYLSPWQLHNRPPPPPETRCTGLITPAHKLFFPGHCVASSSAHNTPLLPYTRTRLALFALSLVLFFTREDEDAILVGKKQNQSASPFFGVFGFVYFVLFFKTRCVGFETRCVGFSRSECFQVTTGGGVGVLVLPVLRVWGRGRGAV